MSDPRYKNYTVKWTENHSCIVSAQDPSEAWEKALDRPRSDTLDGYEGEPDIEDAGDIREPEDFGVDK